VFLCVSCITSKNLPLDAILHKYCLISFVNLYHSCFENIISLKASNLLFLHNYKGRTIQNFDLTIGWKFPTEKKQSYLRKLGYCDKKINYTVLALPSKLELQKCACALQVGIAKMCVMPLPTYSGYLKALSGVCTDPFKNVYSIKFPVISSCYS